MAGKPFQLVFFYVNEQMSQGIGLSSAKFLLRQGKTVKLRSILSKFIVLGEFRVACCRTGIAFHYVLVFVAIWHLRWKPENLASVNIYFAKKHTHFLKTST